MGRLILSINCQDGVVKRELTEGILQGSVISPVLFNIYTANIHTLEGENCKIIQYADDFCIVFGLGDNEPRDSTIQDKIDQLEQIFKYLNLKLNHSKTKLQYFPKTNRMDKNLTINIVMNSSKVKIAAEIVIKYLGINIDSNLNFIKHTEIIKSKVSKRMNALRFIMEKCKMSHPLTNFNLGRALILPIIYYGRSKSPWWQQ